MVQRWELQEQSTKVPPPASPLQEADPSAGSLLIFISFVRNISSCFLKWNISPEDNVCTKPREGEELTRVQFLCGRSVV